MSENEKVAPHLSPPTAPTYGGVKVMGRVFRVFGWICLIVGVLVFLVEYVQAKSGKPWCTPEPGTLIIGGALLFLGLFQIGFGHLFYCVRDMAINSFKMNRP